VSDVDSGQWTAACLAIAKPRRGRWPKKMKYVWAAVSVGWDVPRYALARRQTTQKSRADMVQRLNRRDMLKTTAMLGAGAWVSGVPRFEVSAAPNDKLNIACIGIGGRGVANLNALASQNIVALCDVDDQRAGNAYQRHPRARKFFDYRRMLDQMEKQIDAVVVSTPDHTHFHPCMAALERGKHLYCEKPMAHAVAEVRAMTRLAEKMKVATQLGVQRHTLNNVHRVVELVRSGAIGTVREVYSWVGGTRGMPAVPKETPAVPASLKWDLWLGGARQRPYSPAYTPYNWRFWWDFGTGETGNWGCHILDIPYWALGLKYPTRVDASGPAVDPQRASQSMQTRFVFPADGDRGEVILHWDHAKNGPEILKKYGMSPKKQNTLFIGSDGMLLCGFGSRKLYPQEKFADFKAPDRSLPDSPGFHREWIAACHGGQPATCEFGYSGPLTETVLLGNTAYRAGGGFDWDHQNMIAKGNARAEPLLRPEYRPGWEIAGSTK